MDLNVIKMLSIHVPALLPPTSTELNVPHNVQVAGILGVGLVYQGTAHRHTAEVLLTEIGKYLPLAAIKELRCNSFLCPGSQM